MSMDSQPLLRCRGLVRAFPGTLALAGVDLTVRAGEVHGLVGHNGAGKSTLVRILTGADRADEGTIEWHGRAVELHGPRDAAELGIAVAYQDGNLVGGVEARNFLYLGTGFPRRHGTVDKRQVARDCERLSEQLDLPREIWGRKIAELPGAMKKMVAIAKAIHLGAELIILDEPTSGLPAGEIGEVVALVERLRDQGVGILYVSHRLEEIMALASEVTVFRRGHVVANLRAEETSADNLVDLIGGEGASQAKHSGRRRTPSGEPALKLVWGGADEQGFEVRPGEVLGLTGPAEDVVHRLLRRVVGILPRGRVRVERGGAPFRAANPSAAMSQGVAYLSSDRLTEGGIADFTLGRNLTLSSLGRFAGFPLGTVKTSRERAAATETAGRLGVVSHGIDQLFAQLSGGNQQKALLGRALATGADTFLIDSPTVGVDVGARAEIYALLGELADQGRALLIASSDADELALACDRVVALRDGVIREVPPGEMSEEAIRAAYFGTEAVV
jgi:ribose transport system ATP-binding protein